MPLAAKCSDKTHTTQAGGPLRSVARDVDIADFLIGLARRRNRKARRLAVAKLSEAF